MAWVMTEAARAWSWKNEYDEERRCCGNEPFPRAKPATSTEIRAATLSRLSTAVAGGQPTKTIPLRLSVSTDDDDCPGRSGSACRRARHVLPFHPLQKHFTAGIAVAGEGWGDGGFRWRPRRRTPMRTRSARRGGRTTGLVIVGEFGGTYEEGFEDVHKNIINYFTYKATHRVLHQLYEMNPPCYLAVDDPLNGDYFLRLLAKKCDHAKMYERISNENLEIMRQRLLETVVWPTVSRRLLDKQY
ncbi:uncharacterized protein LOC133893081 [Phragmites australis]|uniref:uncharacterized protein LOC133893081 n=1 Tax=Phragmites australis TaxID=29695 RepID=UPI002D765C50|nr:uncharacterized protein LOC133893081 [Phragmites australis]